MDGLFMGLVRVAIAAVVIGAILFFGSAMVCGIVRGWKEGNKKKS